MSCRLGEGGTETCRLILELGVGGDFVSVDKQSVIHPTPSQPPEPPTHRRYRRWGGKRRSLFHASLPGYLALGQTRKSDSPCKAKPVGRTEVSWWGTPSCEPASENKPVPFLLRLSKFMLFSSALSINCEFLPCVKAFASSVNRPETTMRPVIDYFSSPFRKNETLGKGSDYKSEISKLEEVLI